MKKIIAAVGKYISKKSNDEEAGKEPVLADNMQDEDKVSIPVDNDSVGDYITRMGRLEAELKMSEAELDKEIAGVTERHAKEAVDTVRKWSSLDSAIRAYDKANRRKLFPNPDKLKTCKFSMGKVSIRMKAISLKVNLSKENEVKLVAVLKKKSRKEAVYAAWYRQTITLLPDVMKTRLDLLKKLGDTEEAGDADNPVTLVKMALGDSKEKVTVFELSGGGDTFSISPNKVDLKKAA